MTGRLSESKATPPRKQCVHPECSKLQGKGRRGYCEYHYKKLRMEGVLEVRHYRSGQVDPQILKPLAGASSSFLRIQQAHAKVTQALYILEYPDKSFPKTLEEVLLEALEALEEG